MSRVSFNTDFVIIGAGILGLSIARRLCEMYPNVRISVVEKENAVGLHASGRNSGVMHSGIYYPPGSLKATLCAQGARMMVQYCQTYGLPFNALGKVIVPTRPEDQSTVMMLYERGMANGAKVELVNGQQLRELEPATHSITDTALFVPETTVVDPTRIVQHLYEQLSSQKVIFYLQQTVKQIDTRLRQVQLSNSKLHYHHLINTAGLYADEIAHQCGLTKRYTMLPFKGLYYELAPGSSLQVERLIYPVPDMNVPFLGVHFTKSVYGKVYVGPTAIPALGREQYKGFSGFKFSETIETFYHLWKQYRLNQQGFRHYAHNEINRFLKQKFVNAAKVLVPMIKSDDLVLSKKVGIRAQLLDILNRQLVMDFLTEQTAHETHVLNAVSPAFTSAFRFSEYVVDLIEQ